MPASREPVSEASYPPEDTLTSFRGVGLASLRRRAPTAILNSVGLRCLIVDDSEVFLASAERFLSAEGIEVVGRASDGAEAVRLHEALDPDVVLVDVHLGGESGLELTRRLLESAHAPRVILISSRSEDDLAELIAGSPAAGFLPKSALNARAIERLAGEPRGR